MCNTKKNREPMYKNVKTTASSSATKLSFVSLVACNVDVFLFKTKAKCAIKWLDSDDVWQCS